MPDTKFIIEIRPGERYFTALCSGEFQEDTFQRLVTVMKDQAQSGHVKNVLVDLRKTNYFLDGFARFRVAEFAARELQGLRVAVLGNIGVVDKLTENTAFNRGLKVLVTTDESEALAYLEK